jgi:hypothetical protein
MDKAAAARLKKGDWLKSADGSLYEFVSRRPSRPGYVVLKCMGPVHNMSKRGHRPKMDYTETFLNILEKFP